MSEFTSPPLKIISKEIFVDKSKIKIQKKKKWFYVIQSVRKCLTLAENFYANENNRAVADALM